MWDDPFIPDLNVIDVEKNTNLVHPNGGRIYRTNHPVGFGREAEHRTYFIKRD